MEFFHIIRSDGNVFHSVALRLRYKRDYSQEMGDETRLDMFGDTSDLNPQGLLFMNNAQC